MIDYALILSMNYADKQWSISGNTYDGLEWLDDSPKPTDEQLTAMWPQTDYQNQCNIVAETRLKAYETQSDPLFFKWQRGDATEAEWRAAVAKVKADNPYPTAS